MSQVVIEVGHAMLASAGHAQVFSPKGHMVAEVTSSASAQDAGITAPEGSVAVVMNNGTDAIWVSFEGDAAVLNGHFIAPGLTREFGPLKINDTISVINDT